MKTRLAVATGIASENLCECFSHEQRNEKPGSRWRHRLVRRHDGKSLVLGTLEDSE
jgi:hypothetical protein